MVIALFVFALFVVVLGLLVGRLVGLGFLLRQ